MSSEYTEKPMSAFAMQLKEDNLGHILDWLQHLNVQYSNDEIKSGGQLIVYDPSTGPYIVDIGWWIVVRLNDVFVINNDEFEKRFDRRTP